MEINKKAKEFASYIKNTDEFKYMNKYKSELDKNKQLKRQLDSFINKKNSIYSNYRSEDIPEKIGELNQDFEKFFQITLVSNYMQATRSFNIMMEKLYKVIEHELLK